MIINKMSPPPQKDGDELSKDLKTQEIKNFTCGLRRSERDRATCYSKGSANGLESVAK